MDLSSLKNTYDALKGDLSAQEALKEQYEGAKDEAQGVVDSLNNQHTALAESLFPFFLTFGIILLVLAVFLIVAIVIQSNNSEKGLSSAITGGSTETFYGRNKGNDKKKILTILTIVVAALFIVSVLTVYVFQYDFSGLEALIGSAQDTVNSFDRVIDSIKSDITSITSKMNSVNSQIDSLLSQISGQVGGKLIVDPLA